MQSCTMKTQLATLRGCPYNHAPTPKPQHQYSAGPVTHFSTGVGCQQTWLQHCHVPDSCLVCVKPHMPYYITENAISAIGRLIGRACRRTHTATSVSQFSGPKNESQSEPQTYLSTGVGCANRPGCSTATSLTAAWLTPSSLAAAFSRCCCSFGGRVSNRGSFVHTATALS